MTHSLRFDALRSAYRTGVLTPVEVVDQVLRTIAARGEDHVWAFVADAEALRQRARTLAARMHEIDRLPLFGLPFGVKDNVDVAGSPTACGCPTYSRTPELSSQAVQKALDAGAIFIGKQTLDQFATGLNGTRTLGGHCRNVFDADYIPGGSSSGSGVAVAAGLVSFSLGSDTGGSGRIPAAMNNIVGVRPSIGRVSTKGMVYNNRLFDCIPIFASTVEEAYVVLDVISGADSDEPVRPWGPGAGTRNAPADGMFHFAIPNQLEFFGDTTSAECFAQAVARLKGLGGSCVEIDLASYHEAGRMIFESGLVAERVASYGDVLHASPQQLVPTVAAILMRARKYTAVDAFNAMYRLAELQSEFARQFQNIDVLVTPTLPRPYTVREMLEEPLVRNAEIGYYTYGVGPLDLCAVAVPSALRPDGLPFGVSIIGRSGSDDLLRDLGRRFEAATGIPPGVAALR
ncbi:allophanate hydrolase [Piscinibacter sp.]|uniref:allophanate hydrolase n=1 Tax=Piscinibacter sp. TaxID=1903157 RepID=UPI0039E34A9C